MARIYLASSWRNGQQPGLVGTLREAGHDVYDFRNPPHGQGGFAWSDIDPEWKAWDAESYRQQLLTHPVAAHGYMTDFKAMEWADTFVLLRPCGISAHLELGWACGRGKHTIAYLTEGEPELMYLMVDHLVTSDAELLAALSDPQMVAA